MSSHNWYNIPEELRALPQWMAAGIGGPMSPQEYGPPGPEYKRPIDPKTGKWGSATDQNTWGTFEQAIATGLPLVGFVLSNRDPYVVIDLDTYKLKSDDAMRQRLHTWVREECADLYSERSQSGQGVHIIGRLPGTGAWHNTTGRKRDEIEVYSQRRFMVMTGDVLTDTGVIPEIDASTLLDLMPEKDDVDPLGPGDPEEKSDGEVLEGLQKWSNHDKFERLWAGDKSMHDDDWSRADAALFQFLATASPNNEQVIRLFHQSALANRKKAYRPDYVWRTLSDAREKIANDQPPPLDLATILDRAKRPPMESSNEVTSINAIPIRGDRNPSVPDGYFPRGLMGDFARYVVSAAKYPVKEVALSAAISAIAGIAGRQYQYSDTGLNLYVLLLGKTGTGKETASRCISAVMRAVIEDKQVVLAERFVGEGFSSGQALKKRFCNGPCFMSILGEFGDLMKRATGQKAGSYDIEFIRQLKILFHRSGRNDALQAIRYSEKDKSTRSVQAPALSLLCETAPDPFYENLDEGMIQSGFLPRFLTIEYKGEKPFLVDEARIAPPASLVERMGMLCNAALTAEQKSAFIEVGISTHAHSVLREFIEESDAHQRSSGETISNLWNRAGIKAMRLAALVAVGVNPLAPVIEIEDVEWAVATVKADVAVFLERFKKGNVGEGDAKLRAIVIECVQKQLTKGFANFEAYHAKGCISLRCLGQNAFARNAFQKDRRGAGTASKLILEQLVREGILTKVSPANSKDWFNTSSDVYTKGDTW